MTAPTAESSGRCLYFLTEDGGKAFVANGIIDVWVTDISVRTVTYNDANLEPQDKLLFQFVTQSGEYWTIRTGLLSWAASSLLLGLMQLTTKQLVEPLSIRVTNKGRAVFLNVCLKDDRGSLKRVEVPREFLRKLTYDEALDAITAINQTAQSLEAPEPLFPATEPFVDEPVIDEQPEVSDAELDQLIESIKKPKVVRSKSGKSEAPVEA